MKNTVSVSGLYSVANEPRPQMIPRPEMIPKLTSNDPEPQMIPDVDRKWSHLQLWFLGSIAWFQTVKD